MAANCVCMDLAQLGLTGEDGCSRTVIIKTWTWLYLDRSWRSNCSEGMVVTSKHKSAERKKAYTTFLHHGQHQCVPRCSAFSMLFVSKFVLKREG